MGLRGLRYHCWLRRAGCISRHLSTLYSSVIMVQICHELINSGPHYGLIRDGHAQYFADANQCAFPRIYLRIFCIRMAIPSLNPTTRILHAQSFCSANNTNTTNDNDNDKTTTTTTTRRVTVHLNFVRLSCNRLSNSASVWGFCTSAFCSSGAAAVQNQLVGN